MEPAGCAPAFRPCEGRVLLLDQGPGGDEGIRTPDSSMPWTCDTVVTTSPVPQSVSLQAGVRRVTALEPHGPPFRSQWEQGVKIGG